MNELCDKQKIVNAIANTNFYLSASDWNELMKAINSVKPVKVITISQLNYLISEMVKVETKTPDEHRVKWKCISMLADLVEGYEPMSIEGFNGNEVKDSINSAVKSNDEILDNLIHDFEQQQKEEEQSFRLCLPDYNCDGLTNCRALAYGEGRGCLGLAHRYEQIANHLKELKQLREEITRWREGEHNHCEECAGSKLKQGHWIERYSKEKNATFFKCSQCGKEQSFGTDYCWHCGSYNAEI